MGSASASGLSAIPGSGPRATDHHTSAGPGHRLGAAVLGTRHPGGRRISDGVVPRRWAEMSFGRRLLAALLGLRVRPVVSGTAEMGTLRTSEQQLAGLNADRARPARRRPPAPEATGAGVLAVILVLLPVLAGTATVLLLLAGYLLKMLNPPPSFASTMVGAGWSFAAITVAAVLAAAVGLVITALRRGSTSRTTEDQDEELWEDVARAREAWRHALLERGILPFLRDALADPEAAPASRKPYRPANRILKVGYSRPDFSGPESKSRPAFTSPDFSSPDFTEPDQGGSEPRPE
ncbi:hypothetical protein ACFYY1_25285 [Streptomyces sp. NPDC001890]|uniref:hypothetical protein n=1 Tax=Streptomyces sp. NPDC001890 TaxID=3364620 RepID=UPI0036B95D0C